MFPLFIPNPSKLNMKDKAQELWTRWNFPNCIAVIDGNSNEVPKKYRKIIF